MSNAIQKAQLSIIDKVYIPKCSRDKYKLINKDGKLTITTTKGGK